MTNLIKNGIWSVYIHTNKVNGKRYVGITSKLPEKRWQNGHGYKGQTFYKAIKKYGWDNFEHEIVASNLTEDEASNFERILIRELDSFIGHKGYNVSIGGGTSVSRTASVYQFDLHGNFIKEYHGIYQVERELNYPSSNIVACCKNIVKQAFGYIWRYKDDVPDLEEFKHNLDISAYDIYEPVYQFDMSQNLVAEYENASAAAKHNPKWFSSSILDNCRGKYKHACGYIWRFKKDVPDVRAFKSEHIDMAKRARKSNSVLQFDLEGNFIREFESANDASKLHNCTPTTITYACIGRTKTGVGYVWKYKKDYNGEKVEYIPYKPKTKRIAQYDLDNNFIAEYESMSQIKDMLGFNRENISGVLRGKQKTAYGFLWKYVA